MNFRILAASIVTTLMAGAALAQSKPAVPEIDALSGLAAIAAIGGAVALIWERRRSN